MRTWTYLTALAVAALSGAARADDDTKTTGKGLTDEQFVMKAASAGIIGTSQAAPSVSVEWEAPAQAGTDVLPLRLNYKVDFVLTAGSGGHGPGLYQRVVGQSTLTTWEPTVRAIEPVRT